MSNSKRDKNLSRAISELPNYSPQDSLWRDIEEELNLQNSSKLLVKKGKTNYIKYAAAILLLVVPMFLYFFLSQNREQIRFNTEIEIVNYSSISNEESLDGFDIFLDKECSDDQQICDSPEFQMLLAQLHEINVEMEGISEMIDSTGFDEKLYRAKTKANSETIRIKRALVKLIRG